MDLKKIVTKDELEKRRKRNYLIIGIVMVLLLVISPAAYGLFYNTSGNNDNKNEIVEYKNVKFIKDQNGYWFFSYAGYNFVTRYNPLELNGTRSALMIGLSTYKDQVLSFNWNESQDGVYEIRKNIEGNSIPKRVVPRACLEDNCTGDIPSKSCSEDLVISFRTPLEGENERIYKEDNCVFIVSNVTNQVKSADAFLFNVIGI